MHNAGLIPSESNAKRLITPDRYFNFCVPLNILLDFYENCKRVVINDRHELIDMSAQQQLHCEKSSD